MGNADGLSWARMWIFGFFEMFGDSWVAEGLVVSQVVLCYMKRVISTVGWSTNATSRKVAGSIPIMVSLPNPSSSTMALGFTQPLTETSTWKSFWRGGGFKFGLPVRLTTLPPSVSRLSRQHGSLDVTQLCRAPRPIRRLTPRERTHWFSGWVGLEPLVRRDVCTSAAERTAVHR
jgi:hypothetical protein